VKRGPGRPRKNAAPAVNAVIDTESAPLIPTEQVVTNELTVEEELSELFS
jgi:hypothetical protein